MSPSGTRCRKGNATLLVAMAAGMLLSQVPREAAADGFYATGNLTEPSDDHTATLLDDGRVLVVGSLFADLYDPATGTFTPTKGQPLYVDRWNGLGRFQHAAIRLRNGKVLIVGGGSLVAPLGLPNFPPPFSVYAELYDPATDSFTQTGSMVTERFALQPVLLPDGRVLIAGGQGCCVAIPLHGGMMISDSTLASAEIYDPDAGTFSLFGDPFFPYALNAPRGRVNVAQLADGRILFAGGFAYEVSPTPNGAFAFYRYMATADIYDPLLQTFVPTSVMAFGRAGAAAVALPDGSAYIAYQASDPITIESMPYAPAERFDPISQTFARIGNPPTYDGGANRDAWDRAVVLNNGKVLLAGGLSSTDAADLYDPATDAYARTRGNMVTSRYSQTATKLADGRVLYVGGDHIDPVTGELTVLDSAEIYDPDYVGDPIFRGGFEAGTAVRAMAADARDYVTRSTCPDIDAPYAHFTASHMFTTPDGRVCRMTEIVLRPPGH